MAAAGVEPAIIKPLAKGMATSQYVQLMPTSQDDEGLSLSQAWASLGNDEYR